MATSSSFHSSLDLGQVRAPLLNQTLKRLWHTVRERELSYTFATHFHPYVSELVTRLIRQSIPGLQAADTEYERNVDGSPVKLPDGKPRPKLYEELFTATRYQPTALVPKDDDHAYPVKDLDFSSNGAYAVYNWELFYHVPLTVAIHLSKNQRFEEAQRWLHYIFDPTDDSNDPAPTRFWKVKPFQSSEVELIEDVLTNLADGFDAQLQATTIDSIHAWQAAPFRPHVIARYRPTAYMFKAVMAYLDNLIDWGDSLFRQDTGESINEATQIYVLAANLLGPRPQPVPRKGTIRPQTYANLRDDLDEFGNALRELELDIPFDRLPNPARASANDQITSAASIGRVLYFCVPHNEKLLSYWDTVADRLYKIHNSLNLQGIFRQLPLFEPPIDPALLARAAAAGLDVGAILNGLNQPLPLVRFQLLVQKAAEICQEVKSLGANLLSAIEKEDNEALALLRARHESQILAMVETVKFAQWQEATKTREGLEVALTNATQRYIYYERQLGKKEQEITLPALEELDSAGLGKLKFSASEPQITARSIEIDIAQDLAGAAGKMISSYEAEELSQLQAAHNKQQSAMMNDLMSSNMAMIPEFGAQAQPFGAGAAVKFGGMFLAKMMAMMAAADRMAAEQSTYNATKNAKIGGYARREQEWAYQSNLVAGEISQIFKQLRAAQIREYSAEREYHNHQAQIRHAQEIEGFLKGEETLIGNKNHKKVSTQSLYTWMKREVRGLYGQVYQFAFDIAKKAERALQHELGNPALTYLQFGYMAGKEGLLAGEKLYLDIKRMEMAYHDLNQREYELTKHVSLLQVAPLALLQLRTTGRCTVALPEELFDMDGPGHYFRRIKSVAVSIPCITGPYTGVNCTLTLLKSAIRKSALLDGDYARQGAEDERFSDHFGSLQSIVTSSGQNDSGLFETNLRDERYLPFELSGVISEWQLELPAEVRQFDYDTISDVILHLRYTAREAGGLLRVGAVENLKKQIGDAQAAGSVRLFSVRHEFPTEWARFKRASAQPAELTLEFREEHFPYWSKGRLEAIRQVEVMTTADNGIVLLQPKVSGDLIIGKPFTFSFDDNTVDDLWLALTWGAAAE